MTQKRLKRSPLWVFPETRDRLNDLKQEIIDESGRFVNMDEVINILLDRTSKLPLSSVTSSEDSAGGYPAPPMTRGFVSRVIA